MAVAFKPIPIRQKIEYKNLFTCISNEDMDNHHFLFDSGASSTIVYLNTLTSKRIKEENFRAFFNAKKIYAKTFDSASIIPIQGYLCYYSIPTTIGDISYANMSRKIPMGKNTNAIIYDHFYFYLVYYDDRKLNKKPNYINLLGMDFVDNCFLYAKDLQEDLYYTWKSRSAASYEITYKQYLENKQAYEFTIDGFLEEYNCWYTKEKKKKKYTVNPQNTKEHIKSVITPTVNKLETIQYEYIKKDIAANGNTFYVLKNIDNNENRIIFENKLETLYQMIATGAIIINGYHIVNRNGKFFIRKNPEN